MKYSGTVQYSDRILYGLMNQIIVGSGNLGLAVKLPDGEDLCEWVAVNTVDFYNQIKLVQPKITLVFNLLHCALWRIY